MIYEIENMNFSELSHVVTYESELICVKKGKNPMFYKILYCGFDIETTNIIDGEKKEAYMYHWRFSVNNDVFLGRTWKSFNLFLSAFVRFNELSENIKVIIWVANLPFEFQFFRKRVRVNKVFAKERLKPLYALCNDCLEFRDCLQITGGNLEFLAKNFTRTKKMVGDLDYSIIRNSKTILTEKEKQYCINDVVILSEFSEFIFNEYIIPQKFIPITKTGLLRQKVKFNAPKNIHDIIDYCMPPERLYKIMMRWLFRGGYVHANICKVGDLLYSVGSFDLTSSYPAQMNHGYYPCGRLYRIKNVSHETFYSLIKEECCMFVITFFNIKSITNHSIESKSKCMFLSNDAVIDNGRVSSASKMTVFITEIDFEIYRMFYSWDNFEIDVFYHTIRGKLPRYLLDVLNSEYEGKAILKKQGKEKTKEYAIKKGSVNSAYGLLVTRMVENEVIYDGEWSVENDNFNYEKEKSKLVLLPQWGIYVTAHARFAVLSTMKKVIDDSKGLIDDVVYSDTDSLKIENVDSHRWIFEEYNEKIITLNKSLFPGKPLFWDLGCFDYEGTSEKFKTLGAKRYINTKKGKIEVTIAGLPKGTLQDYCEKKNIDIYEFFNSGMMLDIGFSNKLTTKYNDEYHSALVDGELMEEFSSVALYDIPFTMSLDKYYLSLILELEKEKEKYEKRVY